MAPLLLLRRERPLRRRLAAGVGVAFLLTASLMSGCGGGDGDSTRLACRYVENSYMTCTGYSSSDNTAGCQMVASEAECRDRTKSSNDCTADCCSETIYTDVTTAAGSCDSAPPASGGSGGTSSGSGGTSASGGTSGGVCTVTASDTPCSACLATQCCDELTTCGNSSACSNLLSCVADCGADSACIDACDQTYSAGLDALAALLDCGDASCAADCV